MKAKPSKAFILSLFIIVIFCIGFFVGIKFFEYKISGNGFDKINIGNVSINNTDKNTAKKNSNELSELKDQENLAVENDNPEMVNEATSIMGFINEINENSFTLNYYNSQFEPLGFTDLENGLVKRTVNVSDSTEFYQETPITQEEIAEYDTSGTKSFLNEVKDLHSNEIALPQNVKKITFKDLKYGDYVRVVPSNNIIQSNDPLIATEVKTYDLNDNPYLNGKFESYDELPLAVGSIKFRQP